MIAHGVGLYILMNWATINKLHSPELKPIQITKIIYEPSTNPKVEKDLPPMTRPVEKILTEFNIHKPLPLRSRKKTNQVQPIVASMAFDQIHSVSASAKNPKLIESVQIQSTKPALLEEGSTADLVRKPRNIAQPVQFATPVAVNPSLLFKTFQAEKLESRFRQPHNSVQPVPFSGRAIQPENSLQRAMTVKNFERAIKFPSYKARMIPAKNHSFAGHGKPTQEESNKIRTAKPKWIHPVQLASLSDDAVEGSKNRELEKNLEPVAGQSEVTADASRKNLRSLKKEFSSSIWRKIAGAKYYPSIAQKQRWEGKPVIEFQVGRNGDLLGYSIAVASPYEVLNQAALEAVKNASPYPKIPESLKLNSIRFKLPIAFKLN